MQAQDFHDEGVQVRCLGEALLVVDAEGADFFVDETLILWLLAQLVEDHDERAGGGVAAGDDEGQGVAVEHGPVVRRHCVAAADSDQCRGYVLFTVVRILGLG